jgi:hypothetical protein
MPGGASGATPAAPPTCFLQRHPRHEKGIAHLAHFMRAARPVLPLAASGVQSVPSHYEAIVEQSANHLHRFVGSFPDLDQNLLVIFQSPETGKRRL